MKNLVYFILLPLLFTACINKEPEQQIPEGFKVEKILRYTPVKDQGRLPLCWIYAMVATIETEHIMQGDSVNLSADYVGRMMRLHEGENVPLRGVGPMALQLIEKYGIVPFDSYKDPKLEKDLGFLPKKVFMLGAQYTPLEFAHSVCMPDEYQTVMCDEKKEFYTMQDPELEDNRYGCKALNVPQDSLAALVDRAIMSNHPVFWEGGPNDNHAVSIIGMGHDKDGTKYFISKNSWGEDNPTRGLMYISEEYFRKYTTLVVIQRSMILPFAE